MLACERGDSGNFGQAQLGKLDQVGRSALGLTPQRARAGLPQKPHLLQAAVAVHLRQELHEVEDLRRLGVKRLSRRLALGRFEMLPQQREEPVLRNLKLGGHLLVEQPHVGPQPRIGGQPRHGLRHHGVRQGVPRQLDQIRPHLLAQLLLHTRCARGKGKARGKCDPAELLLPEHPLVGRCCADEPSLDGLLFQQLDLAQGLSERLPPLGDCAV
jgi:hypothetical protein